MVPNDGDLHSPCGGVSQTSLLVLWFWLRHGSSGFSGGYMGRPLIHSMRRTWRLNDEAEPVLQLLSCTHSHK